MLPDALLQAAVGGSLSPNDLVLAREYEKMAWSFMEEQTRRRFGPVATLTKHLDGSGDTWIVLDDDPIAGTLSVAIDGTTVTDWEVRDGNVLVRTYGLWPAGDRNITSIYDAGFDEGLEPVSVRLAVMQLVGWFYRKRVVAVPTELDNDSTFPVDVARVIEKWRVVPYLPQIRIS